MDIELSVEDTLKKTLTAFIMSAVNRLEREIKDERYNSTCYIHFHADNSFKVTDYIPDNSWSLSPGMPTHYAYELYYDKDKGLLVLKLTDEYQEFLRYIRDILPEAIYRCKEPNDTNMLKYFNELEMRTIHSNYLESVKTMLRRRML